MQIENIISAQTILLFFYGLFWAGTMQAASRYRPFDSAAFFRIEGVARKRLRSPRWKNRRAVGRFFVAFIIMNVWPVAWICILFWDAFKETKVTFTSIFAAAFASLSVFGFHRILHALIYSIDEARHRFYPLKERKSLNKDIRLQDWPQEFYSHFMGGVLYLTVLPLFALLLLQLISEPISWDEFFQKIGWILVHISVVFLIFSGGTQEEKCNTKLVEFLGKKLF